MTDWTLAPCTTTVAALTEISPARRAALRDGPDDTASFRAAMANTPALREVEIGGAAAQTAARDTLRVVAWNVERLRPLDAIAHTLRDARADVALLTEIDKGMARTGNTHRTSELAAALGQSYAYGAEFVELDRGTSSERTAAGEAQNALGFHGNAIVSRLTLQRPALFRLEAEGTWFGWARDEPRLGGRLAIGGQVRLNDTPVTVIGLHLESHSDPAHRAGQVARLLDLLALYDPDAPVLIGGDFNTSTYGRTIHGFRDAQPGDDPLRRLRPQPFEPLFDLFERHGFDWRAANVPDAPTQRFAEGSTRPLGKIDWIFSRGLTATSPAVLPAVQGDSTPSSDHEALFVEFALP
ncbi:endonuclease/exonuclease/phosphatase family protein [Pacificibacter sp. AS14]|uniref:endonuclease/exonuclease/phosphatase family protein n=1 Tax=Pacificibacter sp. AS14 TaxID=3135785 RepID=UPI003178189D